MPLTLAGPGVEKGSPLHQAAFYCPIKDLCRPKTPSRLTSRQNLQLARGSSEISLLPIQTSRVWTKWKLSEWFRLIFPLTAPHTEVHD